MHTSHHTFLCKLTYAPWLYPLHWLRWKVCHLFYGCSFLGCYSHSSKSVLWWTRCPGLVVKASTSGAEDPGFESSLRRDFSGSSQTSDFKIGTPLATLPGAWIYRISAGTGQPGVSTLWLGEIESLICNFYLSVAARKIVWADPSLRYTSMLLGR